MKNAMWSNSAQIGAIKKAVEGALDNVYTVTERSTFPVDIKSVRVYMGKYTDVDVEGIKRVKNCVNAVVNLSAKVDHTVDY